MSDAYRIFALGESALTVDFGNEISVELNERAIALSEHFETHPFPGFIETVPAYASTTIFFDVPRVRAAYPATASAFAAVLEIAKSALTNLNTSSPPQNPVVEIPVHFDADSALDLQYLA